MYCVLEASIFEFATKSGSQPKKGEWLVWSDRLCLHFEIFNYFKISQNYYFKEVMKLNIIVESNEIEHSRENWRYNNFIDGIKFVKVM